jgi:hypothetical protein
VEVADAIEVGQVTPRYAAWRAVQSASFWSVRLWSVRVATGWAGSVPMARLEESATQGESDVAVNDERS